VVHSKKILLLYVHKQLWYQVKISEDKKVSMFM
jgi:hypothetical protein